MAGELDPTRTCLLLFDTLNGYLKTQDRRLIPEFGPAVQNMRLLIDAFRAEKAMIAYGIGAHRADMGMHKDIWTDTDNRLRPLAKPHWRPSVVAGQWSGQIVDELAARPEDFVVPKFRWSAFAHTYLDQALRVRGVDTLVLVGGSTDVGVAATAFSAHDLDYNLVIPRDACTAHELDNHEQLMRRIFPRMARVRSTLEVVAMLGR